jgi:hypothetical protein
LRKKEEYLGKKEKIVKMAQLEKTNKAKKELKMAKISKKQVKKRMRAKIYGKHIHA